MAYNKLSAEEARIIINKGTEIPHTGEYNEFTREGTFICRQCNTPLYTAEDKFKSTCGWPSFDDEFENDIVRKQLDADGRRTEILCEHCGGHLGHVFHGEKYTEKDTRHCVNSLSIKFVPKGEELPEVLNP